MAVGNEGTAPWGSHAAPVNEGADPALAQTIGAEIDRVTPADLERLAKVYLQRYTVALVLPRSHP